MELSIDDDIKFPTAYGEPLVMNIPGLTVEVEVRHNRVYISDLRLDGRPFPARGSRPDPFEVEFAARVIAHIQRDWDGVIRRRWADDAPNRKSADRFAADQARRASFA